MIEKRVWGTYKERDIFLYTLTNKNGIKAAITNLGGTLVSLYAPDRKGFFADIVLGYDDFNSYINAKPSQYFGSLIGRHANRIAGAEFELGGKKYALSKNEGENQLHGGINGFDAKVWDSAAVSHKAENSLVLSYYSRDGEEGYPGNLDVTAIYTLTDENRLRIDYSAHSDTDTVVNLTNHSYFNLAGHSSGNVLTQTLQISASCFTPIGKGSIPTGELRAVEGTALDFRKPLAIGAGINSDCEQLSMVKGYDHNFVIDQQALLPAACAVACDEASGRTLVVYTNKPGVQLYTGNFLDGTIMGKDGYCYEQYAGFCLETQHFPDSVHHLNFPSAVLRAGDNYSYTTEYAFLTK